MAGTSSITKILSLRIPNDTYRELQSLALKDEHDLSDFIRILLQEALEARYPRQRSFWD